MTAMKTSILLAAATCLGLVAPTPMASPAPPQQGGALCPCAPIPTISTSGSCTCTAGKTTIAQGPGDCHVVYEPQISCGGENKNCSWLGFLSESGVTGCSGGTAMSALSAECNFGTADTLVLPCSVGGGSHTLTLKCNVCV